MTAFDAADNEGLRSPEASAVALDNPPSSFDGTFEDGSDGAALASPAWTLVGTPQHAEYDSARAKNGALSAWLQGPVAAGSAGVAESASSGMTSNGAELRLWLYTDTASEVRYLYDVNGVANQAFTVRFGADGTIATYTNAGKSATGYAAPGYTTLGTYETGWTQDRVVFDFSGDTFTLSTRRAASDTWTRLKASGAPGFDIPMRTTDDVAQSQALRVLANQNAKVWVDDVAYSDSGIADVFGPYTVTASAGPGGSIAPSGPQTVAYGADSPSFAIAASAGYEISDVLVDGTSVGTPASYQFTGVQANHTILATFRPQVVADMAVDTACSTCHDEHGLGDDCDDCHSMSHSRNMTRYHPGTALSVAHTGLCHGLRDLPRRLAHGRAQRTHDRRGRDIHLRHVSPERRHRRHRGDRRRELGVHGMPPGCGPCRRARLDRGRQPLEHHGQGLR